MTAPATEPEWTRLGKQVEHVGKMKKASKRKVTWELQHGSGIIYNIVLTWSINTGKFRIHVNEHEEVFDRLQGGANNGLLDHSFTIPVGGGGAEAPPSSSSSFPLTSAAVRVVAAKSVPTRTPFVQYDLMINSIKFQDLPGDCFLPDEEGLRSLIDVVVISSSK